MSELVVETNVQNGNDCSFTTERLIKIVLIARMSIINRVVLGTGRLTIARAMN